MDLQLRITCLVDRDPIKNGFSILASPTDSVSDLKKLVKAEKTSFFGNIDASEITLWKALFPVNDTTKDLPAILEVLDSKVELLSNEKISDIFRDGIPQESIHIIAQKPKSGRPPAENGDTGGEESENDDMRLVASLEGRLAALAFLAIIHGRFVQVVSGSTPSDDDDDETSTSAVDAERWEQLVSMYQTGYYRENLVGKLVLWEDRIRKRGNKDDLKRLHAAKEALRIFVFHWQLFGEDFVPRDAIGLFEASLAPYKRVQGAHSVDTKPVLYEPRVALAMRNYFTEMEPKFMAKVRKWEDLLKSPDGRDRDWKELVPAAIIESLAKKPLSSWPHNPEIAGLCQDLIGPSEIIGLQGRESCESIKHESISMKEFLKAHFVDNSLKDGKPIPPFYFPESQASGHDIVFCVVIQGKVFPVFLQLKLRTVISDESTDNDGIRRLKVMELGELCPAGTYFSLIIDYPTAVTATLHRRPDPKPEFYNLQGVTVRVDDGNFDKIFPKDHVVLLNMLKISLKKTDQNDE
ncbi:hypothetical protein BGX26_012738 [Mortierella sp. AD094]|nr:hypothetical protein BGX26_012738 [Mortierella sp. AD094]